MNRAAGVAWVSLISGLLFGAGLAIGGMMIPVYVMPRSMQEISVLSPLAWGLNAFQDVLVRGGVSLPAWTTINAARVMTASPSRALFVDPLFRSEVVLCCGGDAGD